MDEDRLEEAIEGIDVDLAADEVNLKHPRMLFTSQFRGNPFLRHRLRKAIKQRCAIIVHYAKVGPGKPRNIVLFPCVLGWRKSKAGEHLMVLYAHDRNGRFVSLYLYRIIKIELLKELSKNE